MILTYILSASFLSTRILLAIGGIIITIVWNMIYERGSILTRLKRLNPRSISYSLVQIIVFYPQVFGVRILPFTNTYFSSVFNILGLITYFIGVFFATWARISMAHSWGLPGSWDTRRKKRLITNGPFRYSRNPIYVGLLAMCFGFELALNSYLIILTIPLFIYFNWEIQKEEKILEREFGNEYLQYKDTTPRFIFS